MFGDFRQAWRQAVENFWRELEAEEGAGDARTRSLFREVAKARNQLDRLTAEIGDTRQRLAEEREQVDVCVRRARMAADIGDTETVRVAEEYRARHQERADVLARKLEVLDAERGLCRRDLDEMEGALQERRVEDRERAELEDLNRHPREDEFRTLEETDRARSAEERLAELKRRMGD